MGFWDGLVKGDWKGIVEDFMSSAGKSSGKISKPFFEWAMKQLTDANGIMDLTTGQTKSGATVFVEGILNQLGQVLSSEKIANVVSVLPQDNPKPYLSYDIASKLSKSFKGLRESLQTIPDVLGEYKNDSLEFVEDFAEELKVYLGLFDLFIRDKSFFVFGASSPDYSKFLSTRKKMKQSLINMRKCLNSYKKDKYTYESIKKSLTGVVFDVSKDVSLIDAIAFRIFWEACDCLNVHKQTVKKLLDMVSNKTAPSKYDALHQDLTIQAEIKNSIENSLQLTEGFPLNDDSVSKVVGMDLKTIWNSPKAGTIKKCAGWENCVHLAKNELKKWEGERIDVNRMVISSPLVGDYAKQILVYVDYTFEHLLEVVNTGAKNMDKTDGFGGISIDFGTLLGGKYAVDVQKIKKRDERLRKKIEKDSVKKAFDLYDKCKKEYDKMKKLYKNELPKQVFVDLPSSVQESGEKKFDIIRHWDELGTLRKNLQQKLEYGDLPLKVQRKSQKLLRAFEQWNKEFKVGEALAKQREKNLEYSARSLIKQAEEHYNELIKRYRKDKGAKTEIKTLYKNIPGSVSKFVKDGKYNENVKLVHDFIDKKDF